MSKAKENNIYDNIKLLSVNIQSDIPEFSKNVREAKLRIEILLKQLRDKQNEIAEQAAQSQQDQTLTEESEHTSASEQSAYKQEYKQEYEQTKQQINAENEHITEEKENILIAEDTKQPELINQQEEEYTEQPEQKDEKIQQQTESAAEKQIKQTKEQQTEKKAQQKTAVQKQQTAQKSKPKSSRDKFIESLPRPVDQENKRFIDISPPKPKTDNIRRYTSVDRTDRPQRPQRPQRPYEGAARTGTTGARQAASGGKAAVKPSFTSAPDTSKPVKKNFTAATAPKRKTDKKFEEKKEKGLNKRTLIRRGFEADITLTGEDYRMGSKKFKPKKKDSAKDDINRIKIENATVNSEIIPIKTLSDKLGIPAAEITKKLFKDGVIKTINETIDYETAALLAADIGIELELKLEKTAEDKLAEFHDVEEENDKNMVKRPPIVTVMGHVDHGKTSLLDAIKHTNIAGGEAGGITQQIGAYTVTVKGEQITFIDTPGHEAFTAMRARGASITDIAVLVVAADDGIMPQTVEAINHAKAADVPIIVAINKMDKPSANPDKIKQQLTEHGLVAEEWGGDTLICPVSAVKKDGIDNLLENILLVADVKELKANPDKNARGTILEAKLDKGKGPVATVLIQSGTLNVSDNVVAGTASGRIRAMIDDKGKKLNTAGPSTAVSVLGFSEVPNAGDPVYSIENEKLSRLVAQERMVKIKTDMAKTSSMITLDDVFEKIAEGKIKGLNIVLKADLQGSVEAVSQALLKLSTAEVKVSLIHTGVGAINESDIRLAQTASAIIIGFNIRPEIKAKQLAERENVDIRLYRIIYDVTDDVQKALKGMLEPKFKEVQSGQAEIRNVFKISGSGTVAGCYVINGKILRNSKIRLIRDGVVVHEGEISSLKRFKDDVKEVAQGYECGITIENYNDIKEKDIIECYQMEEITDN